MTSLPTPPAQLARMDIDTKPADTGDDVSALDRTPDVVPLAQPGLNSIRTTGDTAIRDAGLVYGKAPPTPTSHPSSLSDPSSSSSSEADFDDDNDYYGEGGSGENARETIRRRKTRRPYKPAYYYPADSNLTRGCPVFEPTMEEFADFYRWVSAPFFQTLGSVLYLRCFAPRAVTLLALRVFLSGNLSSSFWCGFLVISRVA
jgi:hypothetical protein